jgi:hypothetical protein
MKQSKLYSLTLPDWFKGCIVAILSPVLPIIIQTIQAGSLTFDWNAIGLTAIGALFAYLTKNFLTNSSGQLATAEPKV